MSSPEFMSGGFFVLKGRELMYEIGMVPNSHSPCALI